MWGYKMKDLIRRSDVRKDTPSPSAATMTLKNLDDQDSKEFWDHVEKAKREWQASEPSWSRRDDSKTSSADSSRDAVRESSPQLHCS